MVVSKHESKVRVALQYAVLVFALVLVGQFSLTGLSLHDFSSRALENIASVVGMSAGVAPNPDNTLEQELHTKELALASREQALNTQTEDVRSVVADETAKQTRTIIFLIVGVGLFLAALIGVNFYLDYKRRGSTETTNEHTEPFVSGVHAHQGEFTTKL